MVEGTVTVAAYADLLGQLLPLHCALEARLTAIGWLWTVPQVLVVRSHAIACDLVALKAQAGIERLPAKSARIRIEALDAPGLSGACYVVAGSLLGSRVLLPMLKRCLGDGAGLEYHEAAGTLIATVWPQELARLDSLALDDAQRAAVLAGALTMMRGMAAVYADVGVGAGPTA